MGSVRPGDKVLIHGVQVVGVGLAALDICRIIGAETYGTSSPEKHDFLLSHGLHYAIDYRNRDFEKVLHNMTGVDMVCSLSLTHLEGRFLAQKLSPAWHLRGGLFIMELRQHGYWSKTLPNGQHCVR